LSQNRTLVKDYFREWVIAHRATYPTPHPAWPAPHSDEDRATNDLFFDALRKCNATEDEAREATRAIAMNAQARYRSEHPRLIREAIDAARKERLGPDPIAGNREQAAQDSRHCPDCGGTGFSSRVRRDGLQWPVKAPSGVDGWLDAVVFGCDCPLGRWLVASNTKDGRCPFPPLTPRMRELTESVADSKHREAMASPEAREAALSRFKAVREMFQSRTRDQDVLSPSVGSVESGNGHSINANNRHVVASSYFPSGYDEDGPAF
jgi:hypothetical protein